MWLLLIFFCVLITHLCLYIMQSHKHWKKKGVPFVKPKFFVGNMGRFIFKRRPIAHILEDLYNAYPDERYVGFYQFINPTLMVRDPELIKQITVKDFDHFSNHSEFTSNETDPIISRNLFSLTTEEGWHQMRTKVSPTFTPCKLKAMFTLMDQCANRYVDYLRKETRDESFEMKEIFSMFANDIIATTGFGVDCNSLENPNNEFYLMSKDLTNFNGVRLLKFFGYSISPTLMKAFKVNTFSRQACAFFKKIVTESVKVREEKQIVRPDMISLLMKARKEQEMDAENCCDKEENSDLQSGIKNGLKKIFKITDDDIIAQSLGFFFAGFDSTSTLMCYVAYELALNLTIQRRLKEEVDATLKSCDGKLTYDDLVSMRYLDKVISETLRKWPPEIATDRRTRKPFTLETDKPGEKLLYLESGTVCWIPIFPMHRDPKFYPDPDKFDPERFSEKNKHNIKPFTYLPFGTGPRRCVGSRFALLETKLIIVRLLQKFEIVPVKKTQIPIKFNKMTFTLVPEAGFWLGLKPRLLPT